MASNSTFSLEDDAEDVIILSWAALALLAVLLVGRSCVRLTNIFRASRLDEGRGEEAKPLVTSWGRTLLTVGFLFTLNDFAVGARFPLVSAPRFMIFAIVWWLVTVLWSPRGETADKQIVEATDVYTDLTSPMFTVWVTFMVQWAFSCVLLAELARLLKRPQDEDSDRNLFYTALGIMMQLYLLIFVRSESWVQITRLRHMRAAKVEGEEAVVQAPWDIEVRILFAIVANGIMMKFLIIAYPVYVFSAESMVDIVKDAFAFNFVMDMDNYTDAKVFRVFMNPDDAKEGEKVVERESTLELTSQDGPPAERVV